MDSKEIRELIEIISRSTFRTFELEREGFRLKLVKAENASAATATPAPQAEVSTSVPPPAAIEAPVAAVPAAAVEDGLYDVRSPIVGTFYRASGPDTPPFIEIGQRVHKGQVLCIVEAMKVMNEIDSEIDAEVVDAPVANGQPVEYGEVLFRLRPIG